MFRTVSKKRISLKDYQEMGNYLRMMKSRLVLLSTDLSENMSGAVYKNFYYKQEINTIRNNIDKLCNKLEDQMYKDYSDLSNEFLHVFYGPSDYEVIKETWQEYFERHDVNYFRGQDGWFVRGDLNLINADFYEFPERITIEGNLDLEGSKIVYLPEYLTVEGNLDIRNTCIAYLPDTLKVSGQIFS